MSSNYFFTVAVFCFRIIMRFTNIVAGSILAVHFKHLQNIYNSISTFLCLLSYFAFCCKVSVTADGSCQPNPDATSADCDDGDICLSNECCTTPIYLGLIEGFCHNSTSTEEVFTKVHKRKYYIHVQNKAWFMFHFCLETFLFCVVRSIGLHCSMGQASRVKMPLRARQPYLIYQDLTINNFNILF